jgi:hypothetical protein
VLDGRLQRTAEAVKSVGCDRAILTNFDSICYALCHAAPSATLAYFTRDVMAKIIYDLSRRRRVSNAKEIG